MAEQEVQASPTPPFPPIPETPADVLAWARNFQLVLEQWVKTAHNDMDVAGSQYLFRYVDGDGNSVEAASPTDTITLVSDSTTDITESGGAFTLKVAAGGITITEVGFDLDDVGDGTNYAKVLNADITAGHVLLSACTGDLDNISDGSSYSKVLTTDISAGHILLHNSLGYVSPDAANSTLGGDGAGITEGLYLGYDYMGFYKNSGGDDEWRVKIKNDGDFLFKGDANNYAEWDGSNFTVKCTGGFIGSATDYFDITNGRLRASVSGDATTYVDIYQGIISVVDAGNTVTIDADDGVRLKGLDITTKLRVECYSTTNSRTSLLNFHKSANDSEAKTETDSGDYIGRINFYGVNSSSAWGYGAYIECYQTGAASASRVPVRLDFTIYDTSFNAITIYLDDNGLNLLSENLVNAVLASGSGCTIDASLITGGTLGSGVCSIDASNIDAGTMDGARISGGTLGATNGSNVTNIDAGNVATGTMDGARISGGTLGAANGSNLTDLNATNLASGTVADARLPADAVGFKSGSYTGAAGDVNVSLGTGNAAVHVVIKCDTNTRGSVEAIYDQDGGAMEAFIQRLSDNPISDAMVVQHADGFTVKAGAAIVNTDGNTYFYSAWYYLQ